MEVADIDAMSHAERVATMELLWEALTKDETQCNSPKWHENVLADRRRRIESGEAKFYSLEEAENMLRNA